MSNQVIIPPRERACECCGREDVWNDDSGGWLIASENPGSPQCIHEWDINGRYNPFGE